MEANGPTPRGDSVVGPSEVRPRLAQAAAANLSELERVLVETATGANRQVWVTIACKHCERQGRYEVDVPDNRVRLDAVEKLLQQGLGRAREAEQSPTPRLPQTAAAVSAMSWQEQQLLAEILYVDEIAAVLRHDGETMLRARLAALSEAERRVLRDALAQVGA
jgi:hypothetical protein